MTRKDGLPRRVYPKHGRYWYVTPAGQWKGLTLIRDGLPALFRALATLAEADATSDRMPAVIARWLALREPSWAAKQAENQGRYGKVIADAFRDFRPSDVTAFDCNRFLKQHRAHPRTHNAYRTALRQILSYAASEENLRDGANPIDDVPAQATPGRKRWVTDADANAIRDQALSQPRNGKALAQMIELALLTGQRIGDLIRLRWQDVTPEGIRVEQGKGGERLLIEWTPILRAAIAGCERGDRIGHVLQKEAGGAYTYAGIRSAWVRACERAGIEDLHIHDLRGRAGMDKRDADGLEAAKDLLGHRSVKTTEHYVDGKAPRRVRPTR